MSLIKVKNLVKIYEAGKPNEFRALDGVSFSVEMGEFVAVMGASGSGKSTLMNIIGCLDKPTSGEYFLEEERVSEKSQSELVKIRRNKIGFIFQSFNLLPRIQAVANVELPLVYRGISPKQRRVKAKKALEQVGLGNKIRHKPNMLSGGEQQRVAIARALVNEPVIILADEPTGNLDSKSGQQIMGILTKLNKAGTTIILVTHDQKIAGYASRMIRIADGKIIS